MSKNTAGATVESKEKHIGINNAVSRLEDCVDLLENLRNRISGGDAPVGDKGKGSPSLLEVLDSTDGAINEQCNRMNNLISEIKEQLF